ncbi:MAG: hypothetical protein LJE69_07505 [Thiohalocapsa sp.]|uniref:hypothetical protein n=1 Tax=Thiohalocapsa sp. TaxID=2497641 RepID=UPI0025E80DDF|nr:hypothetical protein [Thiohalocapsa sp.]MCG6941081.1 hypothetical protein [Thiohalocapsa sp.]
MKSARIPRTVIGGCGLLLAAAAFAGDWTPSAAPAIPGGAPATALPDQPFPQPPSSEMPRLPPGAEPPAGPFGMAGGAEPPEYDPETGRTSFDVSGLRLTQSRNDDAYLLDIELRGLPAEQVQVRPAGGGLLLVVQRAAETSRTERFGNGYGYQRSWGYSSGQSVKRLPAPPDADVLAMQREDTADAVHISIPRRADLSGYGAEVLPAQPAPGGMPPTIPQSQRPQSEQQRSQQP